MSRLATIRPGLHDVAGAHRNVQLFGVVAVEVTEPQARRTVRICRPSFKYRCDRLAGDVAFRHPDLRGLPHGELRGHEIGPDDTETYWRARRRVAWLRRQPIVGHADAQRERLADRGGHR